MKNARAEASNDFGECRLIFFAREAGQFTFGRLFVVGRQSVPFGMRRQSAAATAL